MLFKFWAGFLNILGLSGPESMKNLLMFIYMVSLGSLVLWPRIKTYLDKNKDKSRTFSKEEVVNILLERIATIMHLREDALFEINQIQNNILRDQMDYAENALDASKNEMLKAYGRVLDHKLESRALAMDSRKRSMNMQMYSFILDKVYGSILSETRRAFRNNGFDDMQDLEFDMYLKKITEVCLSKGETAARQNYNEHIMVISYDEGKSSINPAEIFEQTSDVFKKARRITKKAKQRIRDIEIAYKEESKALISVSPDHF